MMNSTEIKKNLDEIKDYLNLNNYSAEAIEYLNDKYRDFSERFPRLYEGTIENSLDPNVLKQLLNIMKQREDSKLTDHQADVNVGELLVNKYVKPQFNNDNTPNKKPKI